MTQVKDGQKVNVVIQNKEVADFAKKLKEIKPDKRFKDLIPFYAEQIEAFEKTSLEQGV